MQRHCLSPDSQGGQLCTTQTTKCRQKGSQGKQDIITLDELTSFLSTQLAIKSQMAINYLTEICFYTFIAKNMGCAPIQAQRE